MERNASLEMSRAQYERLLKLIALGGWMAQGGLMGSDEDVEDLQQLILSYSRDFGMEDKVTFDTEESSFSLNEESNKEYAGIISEYDEENFWDQIIFRLSNRDAVKIMEEKNLSEEEAYALFEDFVEEYEEEFDAQGLERVFVKK